MNLTPKQWRMLEILGHWGGHGTIEVECQFGHYDFGEGESAETRSAVVTTFVVAGLVRSLVRKGLASNTDGYDITAAGRALLAARNGASS